jgi:hypothetical protein
LRCAESTATPRQRPGAILAAALAASWFAIWGLYSAYTWTTDPTSVTVQVVRFYVPAIGAIALLGAWLVTRIPGRASRAGLTSAAVITAMFGLGVWSFYAMYAAFGVPLRGWTTLRAGAPPREDWKEHDRGHRRATDGYSSGADPFLSRGFRARAFPVLPSLLASSLDAGRRFESVRGLRGKARSWSESETAVTRGRSRARPDVPSMFERVRRSWLC